MYKLHLTPKLNLSDTKVIESVKSLIQLNDLEPGNEYTFVVYSVGKPSKTHDGLNKIPSEMIKRQTGFKLSDFLTFNSAIFPLKFVKHQLM